MKKLLLLIPLLALSLRADPVFFQPKGWALGTDFPQAPTTSEKKTPTPRGDVVELRAALENDGKVFAVERVLYPITIPAGKRDNAYEGGKRGLLRTTPGTLKVEEKITIAGHEGRRYVVERHDGERTMEVHVVIVGNELYQFIHDRFTRDGVSKEAKAFFANVREQKGR